MYFLSLLLPCLAFFLYGLNVTLVEDRIELFMGICWGMFASGLVHALLAIIVPGTTPTVIVGYIVRACLVVGALWNLYVVIGQVTHDFKLASKHFGMGAVSIAAFILMS